MHRFIIALLVGLLLSGDSTAVDDRWPWPVESRSVARSFDAPPEPWASGHRGIDISAQQGTVVTAVADGTIHYAGRIVDRGVVSLAHADGITVTSYEPVHPLVSEGDPVSAGQPIAVIEGVHAGCGSCLHFGVRVQDQYRDPMLWLRLERPVLLPLQDSRTPERAAVRLADEHPCTLMPGVRTRRACRSVSYRGSRVRASPAPL